MLRAMHFLLRIFLSLLPFTLLMQCGSTLAPTSNVVTGPFDSRGNYVEAWADNPSLWRKPTAPSSSSQPTPALSTPEMPSALPIVASSLEPAPKVVSTASKPKPKPVVVKSKPKPKPKPVVVRYSVKRGDSLGKIAARYGVTVGALQKANRISGSLIVPGQVLTIPK